MKLYLNHIAGNRFSNAADYPGGEPFDAPDGCEWVEGVPPDDLVLFEPVNLEKALSEVFDAQSVALRAQFAPLRAAVKLKLDLGHVEVAAAIIQSAFIPPELEDVRQLLLEKLNG